MNILSFLNFKVLRDHKLNKVSFKLQNIHTFLKQIIYTVIRFLYTAFVSLYLEMYMYHIIHILTYKKLWAHHMKSISLSLKIHNSPFNTSSASKNGFNNLMNTFFILLFTKVPVAKPVSCSSL